MSLYIKDIKKYDFCKLCPLGHVPSGEIGDLCLKCSVKEIISPHGRLIDADAFLKLNKEFADRDFIHPKYEVTLRELIDDSPTIVEAEE